MNLASIIEPHDPGSVALISRGRTTTYGDLRDQVAHLRGGLAGLGIICLPTYLTAVHVRAGELVPLLPQWELPPMPLHLVFAPNRYVSHRLRVFIDWMTAQLQHGLA